MQELCEAFALDRVGKSGARFDPEKTKWFNHQYLIRKSDEELGKLLLPVLKEKGVNADPALAAHVCGMVKERCHFISEIWDQSFFLFQAPLEYDPKIVSKRWKDNVPEIMAEIAGFISEIVDWKAASIKERFSAFVTAKEWNFGTVMNSLRLCLVGGSFGPDIFEICEIIGKEETISRIQKAVATIK
jgi:glutamyl-tRNA synthetase